MFFRNGFILIGFVNKGEFDKKNFFYKKTSNIIKSFILMKIFYSNENLLF